MVTAFQESFQQHIQAFRNIAGKNHIPAVWAMEKICQLLPGTQHRFFRLISLTVSAPVNIAAAVFYVMIYCLRHTGRFRKAGAGIVKINTFHEPAPF